MGGAGVKVYSMDEIWKAIESPEIQESRHGGVMGSAIWDDYSVWTMDYDYQEDERNMVAPDRLGNLDGIKIKEVESGLVVQSGAWKWIVPTFVPTSLIQLITS
nr:transcription factor MYB48-like isoform X2 [Ipomoea batatas]